MKIDRHDRKPALGATFKSSSSGDCRVKLRENERTGRRPRCFLNEPADSVFADRFSTERQSMLGPTRTKPPSFTCPILAAAVIAMMPFSASAIAQQISLDNKFAMSPVDVQTAEPVNEAEKVDPQLQHQRASKVIDQVLDRLGNGASFDCNVRQRIRTADLEITGVGNYLQVGNGTGRFIFRVQLHDGYGKHSMLQISDGRLTWTRSQIAEEVSLSRVDVGWLNEGARALQRNSPIKPSMKVGGLGEMLDSLRGQYDLSLGTSQLNERPLVVVIGTLKQSRRDIVRTMLGEQPWPETYPTRINIAIAQHDDPETNFGKGLPVRIEHLGERPIDEDDEPALKGETTRSTMVSLLELYNIRPVDPPPVDRFRFDNQNTEIDFVNETARYEQQFGIHVSAKERQRYR